MKLAKIRARTPQELHEKGDLEGVKWIIWSGQVVQKMRIGNMCQKERRQQENPYSGVRESLQKFGSRRLIVSPDTIAGDINFPGINLQNGILPGDERNKSSQLIDAGRDLNPTCEKHSSHRILRHLTSTEPDLHRIDPNDFMVKKKA